MRWLLLAGGARTIHTASTSKITPPAIDKDPIVKCSKARSSSPSPMRITATAAAVVSILRSTRCLAAGSRNARINSVNKFAHGHADNFAVGLLCEMAGYGVPVVVVPHCKPQLASHPAFTASLQTLRGMGVQVLFDPGAPYERRLPPWHVVVDALPVKAGAT